MEAEFTYAVRVPSPLIEGEPEVTNPIPTWSLHQGSFRLVFSSIAEMDELLGPYDAALKRSFASVHWYPELSVQRALVVAKLEAR